MDRRVWTNAGKSFTADGRAAGGAGKTVSDMTAVPEENFPDPRTGVLESNRNFTLRIRDRERKLLGKIKAAMKRIDDGTFGTCEGAGEIERRG